MVAEYPASRAQTSPCLPPGHSGSSMSHPVQQNQGRQGAMEPIGDPGEELGDFAEEHEQTEVSTEEDNDREPETPARYTGGLDTDGPP